MAEPSSSNGNLGSGTAGGLIAFLDWVVAKNLATPSSMNPLKSASKQIFETVEADGDSMTVDVRSLDLDDYFARFSIAAKSSGRLTPDSLRAYRNRFSRALTLYRDYLEKGLTPKPESGTRTRRSDRGADAKVTPELLPIAPVHDSGPGLISYPFPMGSGEVANLRLPRRLERHDAKRLTAFIEALVFDEPPPPKELGPGRTPEPE